MGYYFIAATILFTVYGQLILKWRIGVYGVLPDQVLDKIIFLIKLLLDPFIFSGLAAAFLASLFWMGAMTKFDVSYAYPFVSLSFVLVFILSVVLLNEPFNWAKVFGLFFIVVGVVISSRSV